MKISYSLIPLVLIFFVGCSPIQQTSEPMATSTQLPPPTATETQSPTVASTATWMPTPTAKPAQPWWNDTVFYQLTVRSFYDSNGDGIGDLNGLIEKLDYLNDGDPSTTSDLGITGIWLLPIHPSPSVHGFDVTDYYEVNPDYGTMEDFRRLVSEAHRRGIRIIIDLVINHTSSQHPWFVQSQDPNSLFRDWYVWSDTDPGFKGFWGQQVWHPLSGAYYYGFFWAGMPDLNYTHPEVTAEMKEITRFWLTEVGIDGFRLDAVGSLVESGSVTVETAATHEWFANYFTFYKMIKPEAMTIGEIWREDAVVAPWVANQEVDLAFEFDLAAAMIESVNAGNSNRLLETLRSGTSQFPQGQYGIFLANHDMTRVMTQFGDDVEKAKAAASLYFSLPGVPFIYYGEEIGMRNVPVERLLLPPMQWNGGKNAGFSEVTPWELPDINPEINVAAQMDDPDSMLSHYRTLISLRNNYKALRAGELFLLSTDHRGLFACLRTTGDEVVLVMLNLSNRPIRDYRLTLRTSTLAQGEYSPVSIMDETGFAKLTVLEGGRMLDYIPLPEIPPYATVMMLVESD